MILSFSTKFKDGTATYFAVKILKSVFIHCVSLNMLELQSYVKKCIDNNLTKRSKNGCPMPIYTPKLHSIRLDKKNRWRAGVDIHFTVFPRSKKMFFFAPVVPCVSIQKIEVVRISDNLEDTRVFVDSRELEQAEAQQLAWNDGFDNLVAFWLFFQDGFEGKIIHWTKLHY